MRIRSLSCDSFAWDNDSYLGVLGSRGVFDWDTGKFLCGLERTEMIDRKQEEINRLRQLLHDIAGSRPDDHLDLEKSPELSEWILETCSKAHTGAYPHIRLSRVTMENK